MYCPGCKRVELNNVLDHKCRIGGIFDFSVTSPLSLVSDHLGLDIHGCLCSGLYHAPRRFSHPKLMGTVWFRATSCQSGDIVFNPVRKALLKMREVQIYTYERWTL
jgi:hypothetical protein